MCGLLFFEQVERAQYSTQLFPSQTFAPPFFTLRSTHNTQARRPFAEWIFRIKESQRLIDAAYPTSSSCHLFSPYLHLSHTEVMSFMTMNSFLGHWIAWFFLVFVFFSWYGVDPLLVVLPPSQICTSQYSATEFLSCPI